MWQALFLLITTLLGDVASGMKWRRLRPYSPLPTAYIVAIYYISRIFVLTAHRKEVGRLWHCSKVDKNSRLLFCYKVFLLIPLIKEFIEIWHFCPWICTCYVTSPLSNRHEGDGGLTKSACFWGESACWGGGGGGGLDGLGRHLGNSSFCLFLLTYMTSALSVITLLTSVCITEKKQRGKPQSESPGKQSGNLP
jgi:hypothetical protein